MSSTATTTRPSTGLTLQAVLADYDLHHSSGPATSTASNESASQTRNPPAGWDDTHRRVPAHRPTNRQRDPLETRVYTSTAEQIFISVMFTGVFINSTAAKTWHRTFGRLNDNIFRYRIGGEM
ncbi:hypothetical protein NKR23_g5890 [Pleurostoma richardsiae]|uniref:Uncharacterized protein n=1 Tax=Pleurostoma richardsiae TaxID=41990 RepID=A0AA38REQ0_9PEZI|nr:hypothetical protein NKR23_g5890 [Pleurostoma richardsiae]